jgi:hypothetical protein
MVPPPRLERGTPRSTIWCSNQLSYGGPKRRLIAPVGKSAEKSKSAEKNGGRTRARTLDPLIKSQLLYQLSYAPVRLLGAARARHVQNEGGDNKWRTPCPALFATKSTQCDSSMVRGDEAARLMGACKL